MSHGSLEDALQAAGDAVALARNSQLGPYVYPAVPAEFSKLGMSRWHGASRVRSSISRTT